MFSLSSHMNIEDLLSQVFSNGDRQNWHVNEVFQATSQFQITLNVVSYWFH